MNSEKNNKWFSYKRDLECHCGPVNIGRDDEVTIRDLADLISTEIYLGQTSKYVFEPPREDDPMTRRPDIRLALKELGWKAETSLVDGIKRTIQDICIRKLEES